MAEPIVPPVHDDRVDPRQAALSNALREDADYIASLLLARPEYNGEALSVIFDRAHTRVIERRERAQIREIELASYILNSRDREPS